MKQLIKDSRIGTAGSPSHFLLIQTAFIGDVILATSVLETLHRQFPDSRLDILVRKGNETLFAGHPFVQEVLVWDKKGGKYKSLWSLLKQIRANNYAAVINLQRYGATGLLTALSGAEERIGFDKNPFSFTFTQRLPHHFEPGVHEIDRNFSLIRHLVSHPVARPRLYPLPADSQAVGPLQKPPYICIAPASVWFTKQYPAALWAQLIDRIPHHYTIYLLGGPGDQAIAETILSEATHPRLTSICGQLTLLQSAALFQKAVLNYVNDSAPLHLCSAVNAPVCAVYCSTVPEFGYGPLSDESFIFQTPKQLDCRPCGIHGHKACPKGHFECARSISIPGLAELLPSH